jgi:rubrerythrin
MSVSFAESQTKTNLLRAFAGESQARNRYTFAAGLARKNDLYVLEAVFQFTASQELAHAKAFYDYLEGCSGENIPIDGAYPIDLYPTLLEHLRSAQHNEYQEYEQDYTGFAHTAKEEGFPEISHLFSQIARIEQTHGDRFGRFADLLEQDKLFISDVECQWMCLNCGYVATVTRPPERCPVCKHPQGYFLRLELSPFQG